MNNNDSLLLKESKQTNYVIIPYAFLLLLLMIGVLTIVIVYAQPVVAQTLGSPIIPENGGNNQYDPKVTSVGRNVYVIWYYEDSDDRGQFVNSRLVFSRSTDNGASFEDPINLTSKLSSYPNYLISASQGNVYVMWNGILEYPDNLVFSRSTDSGATFHQPVSITSINFLDTVEQAISNNNIYVVFSGDNLTESSETESSKNEIFFTRSTDNGASFEAPKKISNTTASSNDPKIASDGDDVYIIWQDIVANNYREMWFAKSNNSGASFEDARVVKESTGREWDVKLAASGGNIYIVSDDDTTGTFFAKRFHDVAFIRSSDNGANFEAPKKISNNGTGYTTYPAMLASGDHVYIAWINSTTDEEAEILGSNVFFSRSTDNGASFEAPKKISNNGTYVQLAANNQSLFAVWTSEDEGVGDIYCAKSSNDGASFGRITGISGSNDSSSTDISTSANDIYFVWEAGQSEPDDDFYRVLLAKGCDS